ncbi:MAG: protein kinase [Candidatus Obscuribacterales bacterium]|nr:protein kinase [Candidatus Obscuribacterales bacterium]
MFASKYQVIALIGSGASGQVYKVEDIFRKILVAIKLLHPSHDQKQLMRFQNEAKVLSSLRHENIATIFDFGIENQIAFIAMEFVDGPPLDDYFKNSVTDLVSFCDLFTQVARGIAHAHTRDVVHRDLKPTNILVAKREDGSTIVKILDFGLAKRAPDGEAAEGKLTGTGMIVGTPLFMSPEQALSLPLTTKSDVYSLGAIMFYCLARKAPLEGRTAIETITLIAKSEVPSIAANTNKINFKVPKRLFELIDSMLEKQPSMRPSVHAHIIPSLADLATESGDIEERKDKNNDNRFSRKQSLIIAVTLVVSTLVGGAIGFIAFKKSDSDSRTQKLDSALIANVTPPDVDKKSEKEVDEQLAAIAGMNGPTLDLNHWDIDDSALLSAKSPEQFTVLILVENPISELSTIGRFKNLKYLDLKGTKISDKSLEHLVALPISYIDVTDTSVGDEGLRTLSKIKTLTNLNVSKTNVTAAGLRQILLRSHIGILVLENNQLTLSDAIKIAPYAPIGCTIFFGHSLNNADIDKLNERFPDITFIKKKIRPRPTRKSSDLGDDNLGNKASDQDLLDTLIENKTSKPASHTEKANRNLAFQKDFYTLGSQLGKSHSQKEWLEIREQFEDMLITMEKSYSKTTPKLASFHNGIAYAEQHIERPGMIKSAIAHYLATLDCAAERQDLSLLDEAFEQITILGSLFGERQSVRTALDKVISVARNLGANEEQISAYYTKTARLSTDTPSEAQLLNSIYWYERCIEYLSRTDPNRAKLPAIWCYMGDRFNSLGRWQKAFNCFEKSIDGFEKSSPLDQYEKFVQANAYEHAGGIALYKLRDLSKATRYYDRCYQLGLTTKLCDKNMLNGIITRQIELAEILKKPASEIALLRSRKQ